MANTTFRLKITLKIEIKVFSMSKNKITPNEPRKFLNKNTIFLEKDFIGANQNDSFESKIAGNQNKVIKV